MNTAYKTLDDRMRLGPFTVGQWALLIVIAFAAIGWALYLSPFGTSVTLVTTIYAAGIPAGLVLIAGISEFSFGLYVRAFFEFRGMDGRYLPGPGSTAHGYVVLADDDADTPSTSLTTTELDFASLWD